MKKYPEDKKICAACGGACCKHVPGVAYPGDFDHDIDRVRAALKSGLWALRGGTERYLEPKTHHGVCVFLKENGCLLTMKDRPLECKVLRPLKGGGCRSDHIVGRPEASEEWGKYPELFKNDGGF